MRWCDVIEFSNVFSNTIAQNAVEQFTFTSDGVDTGSINIHKTISTGVVINVVSITTVIKQLGNYKWVQVIIEYW